MKKIILTILLIVSILGTAIKYIYEEFSELKQELSQIKATHLKLKQNNKSLINKQKKIKQQLNKRRNEQSKKILSRAKNKLTKASVGVIPFIGTSAVIALTYDEIQGYCNDVKELREFNNFIFDTNDSDVLDEEKLLCNYDYDITKKIILQDMDDYKNQSATWINTQYGEWKETIQKFTE